MRGYVATTDYDWFTTLRQQPELDEVNFWTPSGRLLTRLAPNDFVFFKLKAPHNVVGGFGVFVRSMRLPDWLAWDTFGVKNGASSSAEFHTRIAHYRRASSNVQREVGCLVLIEPVFFSDDELVEQPREWKKNIVAGAFYDLSSGDGLRLLMDCMERTAVRRGAISLRRSHDEAMRFSKEFVARARLGQGAFRVAVTDAYERACAITGEHSLPVLEAAHIKPVASGGLHRVSNGVLLRTDIHRLLDRGYVTFDEDERFVVSRRLRDDFENGRTYYALEGTGLRVPRLDDERPSREALAWHREQVFLG